MTFTRRDALQMGAAGAAVTAAPQLGHAHSVTTPQPSLNQIAASKGMRFGSATAAVGGGSIQNPDYAAILVGECGLLVPENEMKMYAVRPTPDRFDFAGADEIMEFAARHGLAVRGHNLFWHKPKYFPGWLKEYDFGSRPASAAEKLLIDHITTVCRHFGDRIHSWDVVNETIDQDTGALRETVFTRHLGERVIDICFHAAREALPTCQLVYNDYMEWEAYSARHRDGVLRFLERLRRRNVPVDALGLQSHIGGDADLLSATGRPEPKAWHDFLREVTGLGLDLLITEFDVNDRGFPSDPAARDRAVADYTTAYLDVTLSLPQVHDVLCWGMVDKLSWLNERSPRADGLSKRPCPYDDAYQPKPLRFAIGDALRAAPARTPPHPPHA
jgi:endo-1,4-beta-xylanase